MKFALTCILALVAHVASRRATVEQFEIEAALAAEEQTSREESQETSREENQVQACSAATCSTFAEAKCSCSEFVSDPALMARMHDMLRDTLQRLRKVSDKLTEKSGIFQKLWWGSSVGAAQKSLRLLEEGVEHLSGLRELMDSKPVNVITSADFAAPAGVYPIVAEIWDADTISRNTFIGETGVSLLDGENEFLDKPLELNTHHTGAYVQPRDAKVSFTTSVTKSSPFDCDIEGVSRCIKIKLKVQCLSASNLPNTDTGVLGDVTDAYCKVRVKKTPNTPSMKLKTEVVANNLNPEFASNVWDLEWDAPIIEPVPTNSEPQEEDVPESDFVPWTIDQGTLGEQMESEILYLATHVFLDDESRCKSATFQKGCQMIDDLSKVNIDFDALQGANDDTPASSNQSSALVELALSQKIHVIRAAAIHGGRRARNRRRGGGGGGYHRHGGDGGCSGCWLFLCLFLLLFLL